MDAHPHLDSGDQAQQQMLALLRQRCSPTQYEQLRHVAPVLAELLREAHDHPMAHFYATVRETVLELCPLHLRMPGLSDTDELEQCVAMLIEILEDMRCAAVASGAWSDAPCPQQYFG